MTNKRPLPVHLLVDIRGFSLLGQTSFGGYFKIILAWWLNDCPEIFTHQEEWSSLSTMRTCDYAKYKSKIEPLLIRSFEVLTQFYNDEEAKSERRRVNLRKAIIARDANTMRRNNEAKTKASLVDCHVNVNPTAIKPPAQSFHDGWNLNKRPAAKPASIKPSLIDK